MMITCISREIMFTITIPKLINIAETTTLNLCNSRYSFHQTCTVTQITQVGEWRNIDPFWYKYGKYISIADTSNGK